MNARTKVRNAFLIGLFAAMTQVWAVSGRVATFDGGKYSFSGGSNITIYTIQDNKVVGKDTIYRRSGSTVHSPAMNVSGTHCAFMRSTTAGSFITVVPVGKGNATDSAVDVAKIDPAQSWGHVFWTSDGTILYYKVGKYELRKIVFRSETGRMVIEDRRRSLFQYEPQDRYVGISGSGDRISFRIYGNDNTGLNKLSTQVLGTIPADTNVRMGPSTPGFKSACGCGNGVSASGEWAACHGGSGHEAIGIEKFDKSTSYWITYVQLKSWLGTELGSGGDGNRFSVNSDWWISNLAGINDRFLREGADCILFNRDTTKRMVIDVTRHWQEGRRSVWPFIGSFWVSTREEVNPDLRPILDSQDQWRVFWDKAIRGLAASRPSATAVARTGARHELSPPVAGIAQRKGGFAVSGNGWTRVDLYSPSGRLITSARPAGGSPETLLSPSKGVYCASVVSANGRSVRKLVTR